MSNPLFHNNTVNINDVWFESHNSLLQQLCVELGHTDRIDEMREKFLGVKLKMKAYKDPNKPKRAKAAYFYFCDEARPAIINKHKKAAGKKGKINMGNILQYTLFSRQAQVKLDKSQILVLISKFMWHFPCSCP